MKNRSQGSPSRAGGLAASLRRPIEQWNMLYLGIAAVTVVVLVIAAVVGFSSLDPGRTTISAEFAQAAELESGDQVTMAGVPVGEVTGMRLDGDRVLVTMKVDDGIHLGSDTRAAIKLTTLLGSRYISLMPAGGGRLSHNVIPLRDTEVPYDLQDALQNATSTFEKVDATKIATAMSDLSTQLQGAPDVVPQALRNIETLSSVIASRRDQIGDLIRSTSTLTTTIRDQQSSIGSLLVQGRDLFTELDSRRDAVERLFTATTGLVNVLHKVVVVDRPAVQSLIDNLDSMLGSLARHDDLLRNILQILPVPVRNFTNATGTGNDMDFTGPAGIMMDSWMCALSGRAQQVGLRPYFQDCK